MQYIPSNPIESWHKSLKIQAKDKEVMAKFSLAGAANHIMKIADQLEQQGHHAVIKFRSIRTAEYTQYSDLELFPGPVQSLIVDQLKQAMKAIDEGEPPKRELEDDLICQCLFYRSYQLPCRYIWQFQLFHDVITARDWRRWANMFEDGGSEIYESTTKTYAIKEIHEVIGGPSKGWRRGGNIMFAYPGCGNEGTQQVLRISCKARNGRMGSQQRQTGLTNL